MGAFGGSSDDFIFFCGWFSDDPVAQALRSGQAHPPSVQALTVISGETPYFSRSLQPG